MVDNEQYLTVTDLNYYISQKFKRDPYLAQVFLKGEITNFRQRNSRAQFFEIKDKNASISAVMFQSDFAKLKFKLEDGMEVYLSGYVSTYQKRGGYQFYVKTLDASGVGALYKQFEQLKAKLDQEGLFAQALKKPIPKFPDKIAVVTSESGAVIHDIMVTANRRFPHAEIDLYPAKVQGEGAAESLVQAMKQIQACADDYDVMIIGRGGGSLEDLWPFNEEIVARQVFAMTIPVISSVGHETDVTLCDLVADQRAATPTAAAELATPNLADELTKIKQLNARLLSSIQTLLKQKKQQVSRLASAAVLTDPSRLYAQQEQYVAQLKLRLSQNMRLVISKDKQVLSQTSNRLYLRSPSQQLQSYKRQHAILTQKMSSVMELKLNNAKHDFSRLVQQLQDYSPLNTLARGYAYVSEKQGQTITKVNQLSVNEQVVIHLQDGEAISTINEIKRK